MRSTRSNYDHAPAATCSELPTRMERAKGFFRFAQEPELQEFQFFPPRTSSVAPVMLLDEPDHAVVLIGRDYDQELYRKSLLACLVE